MPAAYDTYDYPSYWIGREYEHASEVEALKSFLEKIPEIKRVVEVGAGYGRLTPHYAYRAKKIILSDPSAKLLSEARRVLGNNKFIFLQASLENLLPRLKGKRADLVIMVRVVHHLENVNRVFGLVNQLLKSKGYFIFEFANKRHFKASFKELMKGNVTFPLDITPLDKRSKRSIKKKTLPFINYHPDVVRDRLEKNGFEILDARSVSNIRSSFLKRHVPKNTLLSIEKVLQKPLSLINFGPSIFILARKKGALNK